MSTKGNKTDKGDILRAYIDEQGGALSKSARLSISDLDIKQEILTKAGDSPPAGKALSAPNEAPEAKPDREKYLFLLQSDMPQPQHYLDVKSLNPLSLAYIGDAAYELIMRDYLIRDRGPSGQELHKNAVRLVNSHAQARAMEHIMPLLTEREAEMFRRGRNAHVGHVPKGSSTYLYHMATALECLFGYLYLTGDRRRLFELSSEIYAFLDEKNRI